MKRLLIANRGEIACRIARSARALGIATIAVYTPPDVRALHLDACDEAVPLDEVSAYLSIEALLDACGVAGADAVHPGYGFLAEHAGFAQAVLDAGLTWVGPSPAAITAMGDKLRAKELMATAGVPVLASTTEVGRAAEVGFPLMVKAAFGGGGKGMRLVRSATELAEAVAAAQREALAAFGDATVFLERYVERPRHIEVQVLGDAHGALVHLGERECSLQRRHQKVIEEAPSPLVDAALRERLGDAAVTAAKAIGYESAGTVEFVADQTGEFSFLEVNTRLQVEHPVTEEAWRLRDGSRLDLVALQLRVARGEPLPFSQGDLILAGHAIEARLYAEDPAHDFLPAAGRVAVFAVPQWPRIRVDSGVAAGSQVTADYDPLLAKVIAAAPTRHDAAALLATALERTRLHGVVTNRDTLVALLRDEAFVAGDLHTGFIAERLRLPEPDPFADAVHAAAATLAALRERRRATPLLPSIPAGWRNNRSQPQVVVYDRADAAPLTVSYAPAGRPRSATADRSWSISITPAADHIRHDGGSSPGVDHIRHGGASGPGGVAPAGGPAFELEVEVVAWPDERAAGALDLIVEPARRMRVEVVRDGDMTYLDSPLGHASLRERPRFAPPAASADPGSLLAPMPGTVVRVVVAEGDRVAAGDLLLILEAMKMEHRVTAPAAGTVTALPVAAGARVDRGDVLAVLTETLPA